MRAAVVLLVGVAACASSADATSVPVAATTDTAAETELRAATGVDWLVDLDVRRGTVTLAMPRTSPPATSGTDRGATALRFLSEHPSVFGDVGRLGAPVVVTDPDGAAHVRLLQGTNGYVVHFAKDGTIAFVNGTVDPKAGSTAGQSKAFELDGSGKGVRFYPPISDPGAIQKLEVSAGPTGFVLVRAATNGEPTITTTAAADTPIASTTPDDWDPLASGAPGAGEAVDAHHNVAATVAWYHDVLGWTDFGQPETGITVRVHVGFDEHATYSEGGIDIGDGDVTTGGDNLPYSGLTILAHELTHGVTQQCSGLSGSGEEGTLNEALSDIFASLVSHDVTPGSDPFAIGAESTVSGKPLRSLSHPGVGVVRSRAEEGECNLPATPPDNATRAYAGTCDSSGAHLNVGIPGNAFALMTAGGTNDTSGHAVRAPLGWEASRKLWWLVERTVLVGDTRFSDIARWQLAVATKNGIPVAPVACAWRAVGVLDDAYLAGRWSTTCD